MRTIYTYYNNICIYCKKNILHYSESENDISEMQKFGYPKLLKFRFLNTSLLFSGKNKSNNNITFSNSLMGFFSKKLFSLLVTKIFDKKSLTESSGQNFKILKHFDLTIFPPLFV